MWRKEAIPQEFKDATIIHLFKRKGNPQVCDNHRGISLLPIAGKILAWVLLNRLNEHLEQSGLLPESESLFVCVEVLRPSQPSWVMSSAVSSPNHTFTGQA